MTVRAYFDGSGKSHDPNTKIVVCAGYLGSVEVIEAFENRWAVFKRENNIEFSHASDLNAARGEFAGHDPFERAGVRIDLVTILREFNVTGLRAVAHAVSMEAYRKVNLPTKSPESICGEGCLTTLCDIVAPEDTLQVFYDRGESFFTRLHNNWRHAKKRRADPRLNRVNVFSEVDDWRNFAAMQAADYLAYCISKRTGVWPWRFRMLTAGLELSGKYYGRRQLEALVRS
jgi:hypothetical protein